MRQFTDIIRILNSWPRPHRGYGERVGLAAAARRANRASDLVLPAHLRRIAHSGERGAGRSRRSQTFFERMAPEEAGRYRHADEGPDDMPAHIRTALTGVQLAIPIVAGRLALGAWQGISCSSIAARGAGAKSPCI